MTLSLSLLCLLTSVRAEAAKPNIVLIMADDLGWGDTGFNGNTVIQTPHLDLMAKDGLKFNRFYAAAPVCSPTRGSVLSGRHPFRYGIATANSGHLLAEERTLAELLRKLGYTTGHFGKWHLGTLTKTERDSNRGGSRGAEHFSTPVMNGFDVNFSTEAKVPTWDPLLRPTQARRTWWDPIQPGVKSQNYGTAYWDHHGNRVIENMRGDDSRVIMDRVIPFIDAAVKSGKPFFTVVWFHAPHLPVVAGPKYTALYSTADKYAQHYYGCVTALDEQVGRLRAELDRLGVAEDTLITFCSDNGPEGKTRNDKTSGSESNPRDGSPSSAGPFRGRKRDLFEGGIRVPGVIVWPREIKAGSITDYPAVTSDYLPTILEVVDVKLPETLPIDGVSLLPVFKTPALSRRKSIGFHFQGRVALVGDRYKLIQYPEGTVEGNDESLPRSNGEFQLFDLLADPGETTDIAAKHPDVVSEMSQQLDAWLKSCRRSASGGDYH